MVISCSTCQKEEKECIQVKYLIYADCHNLHFFVIYTFFPAKCHIALHSAFPKFQSSQNFFFPGLPGRMDFKPWLNFLGLGCTILSPCFVILKLVALFSVHVCVCCTLYGVAIYQNTVNSALYKYSTTYADAVLYCMP